MTPSAGSRSRVTTIVAPAGYGKSTLVRELVGPSSDVRDGLYLSLRDCEHHPALFLDLLVSAVQRHLPSADLRPLLMLKKSSPVVEYGERLPYALARVFEPSSSGPVVLALDDVHEVTEGEPLSELLGALLASEPGRLRFVLASRRRLSFSLAGYRDRGEVLELKAADLALTVDEVAAVLALRLDRAPTSRQAHMIWKYTRGWPAIVGLLGLDRQGAPESQSQFDALSDFVVSQVLGDLSPPLRYVLKAVSVLAGIESGAARFLLSEPVNGRQLRRPMSRFISVPESQVGFHLDALRASQLLVPPPGATGPMNEGSEGADVDREPDGESDAHDDIELNPAVRDVLRELFEREDPRAFRQAHHRAAEHYLAQESVPTASTIEHLVKAGDLEHVLALLEDRAECFFDGGSALELSRWLRSLEAHFATLPMWARYYLGRHYTAVGDWDRARGYLEDCKAGLKECEAAGELWRWQPRVCLGFATLYWRRGMSDEARTYCRRGLDFMRQLWRRDAIPEAHRGSSRHVQLDLLNLLGRLKLERGIYDKAEEIATEALTLAKEVKRPGAVATALCQLGVVASHRGDFDNARQALESAVERVDACSHPRHHALATFELGRLAYRTGDTARGRALIEDAVPRVAETGHPATMARLHGVLGEIRAADGDIRLADAAFEFARALCDEVADTKIRAEVLDRHAIFLATRGREDEAHVALKLASAVVAGQLKTQLHLNARHYEARAECAATQGDHTKAEQHFRHAVERSQRIGARYHVARLGWRAALHCHEAFVAGVESNPEPVLAFLDIAVEATRCGGPVLGDTASLEVLHIGSAFAQEPTRTTCTELLQARGVDDDGCGVAGLAADVLERYRDYRRRAELEDDFVLTERSGRRGANARDVECARAGVARDAVVLLVEEQLLINAGVEVSLAEKRVILPLLSHFLHHPDEVFTMTHLSVQVWGAADARKTMQTKVKVAISRLRGLLGKDRPYILTSRVAAGDDGETVVAYGLAPDFPYLVVERVAEDSDA